MDFDGHVWGIYILDHVWLIDCRSLCAAIYITSYKVHPYDISAYLMGCPIRGVILDPIVAMQMGIQGQVFMIWHYWFWWFLFVVSKYVISIWLFYICYFWVRYLVYYNWVIISVLCTLPSSPFLSLPSLSVSHTVLFILHHLAHWAVIHTLY